MAFTELERTQRRQNAYIYGLCWCGEPRHAAIKEDEARDCLYMALVCPKHGEDCGG